MRILQNPAETAVLSVVLFPFLSSAAGNIDCHKVIADGAEWNLEALGGPRSVMDFVDLDGQEWKNTTYTIDICKPLKLADKEAGENLCPMGSRICAMERIAQQYPPGEKGSLRGYPIAGDLKDAGGGFLDAKWTRISTSNSNQDSQKEGLLLTMNGGFHKDDDGMSRKTKATVEFVCDKNVEGTEHFLDPQDKYLDWKEKRTDGIDSTKQKDSENEVVDPDRSSLIFLNYDTKGEVDILYLQWPTKYACEDAKDGTDAKNSAGWGFFTWFIIVAFLSTATYLIFGSWLNYNRYGARGWDLLPHGDTIRDVPYLLKDWTRRVLSTIQGSGSRGGYAAV